jgi:tetratricopeptide (TPR) repeat protein
LSSTITHDNNNSDGKKKALVIAVSDYDDSSGLKSIGFCKNDGQEIYNILKKIGYDIPDNRKLIGYVDSESLKKTIYDFFINEGNRPDDTLVFYYSGHGIPDNYGRIYLAPSNGDSEHPFISGFSFDDLTNSMLYCISLRLVTILDSCFSGSLKIGKGLGLDNKSGEEATARVANKIVEEKSEKLKQGIGRCLLASSQGYEEAYDRQEKDHSIFTYYLLEGLKGNRNSVDDEGNVTYDTLGRFISQEMGRLSVEKRPKQTPLRKGEVSGGEIILASYPSLGKNKIDFSKKRFEANKYFENKEYTKALQLFDEVLYNEPNDFMALLQKGNILSLQEKHKEAIECYDKVLSIDPSNVKILKDKGLSLVNLHENEKAIECYDKVLEIDSKDEKALYFKGVSFFNLLKYVQAIEYFDDVLRINSNYVDALKYKGKVFDISNKFDEAIECLDKAIEIDPKDAQSWFHKGFILYRLKEYDEAIECLDKAIEIDPKDAQSWFHKGLAHGELKEYDEAIECYNKTMEIDINFVDAKKHKELIENGRLSDKIFISCDERDSEYTERLYNDLKIADLNPLRDKDVIKPNQNWKISIRNSIKNSRYFIPLFSSKSVDKIGYVQKEFKYAIDNYDKFPESEVYIIPARLDNCDIPFEKLQDIQYVDLFPDWNKGVNQIIESMGIKNKGKINENEEIEKEGQWKTGLSDKDWADLLLSIQNKKCIPFIGPGIYVLQDRDGKTLISLFKDIVDKWKKEYKYPLKDLYDLAKVYTLEDSYQLAKLAQFLEIEMTDGRYPKNMVSGMLKEIKPSDFFSSETKSPYDVLSNLDLPIYLTTNYDRFMEETLSRNPKKNQRAIFANGMMN